MVSVHDPIRRAACAVTLLVGLAGSGLALAAFLAELPHDLMVLIGITVFLPPWGGVVLVAPVLFVVCAVLMIRRSVAAIGLIALIASCSALVGIPIAVLAAHPVMWAYVGAHVLVGVLACWAHARSRQG